VFKFLRLFPILLAVLALATPATSRADTTKADPLKVWSSGHLDPDNSVYYSTFVSTGADEVKGLTVTSLLPKGAKFVKDFWKPAAAKFVGEKDGVVTWTLETLAANSIAGPFAYVVTYENASAKDFKAPAFAKASAVAGDIKAESKVAEDEVLTPLAATGTITVDEKGTKDLAPVGDTGIWVNIPAGAVSKAVTLTFNRLTIDDKTVLPKVADETWWCSLVSVTAGADVQFSQPIVVVVPTRRPLPAGAQIPVFTLGADGSWTALTINDGKSKNEALIGYYGTNAYVLFDSLQVAKAGMTFAVGISTNIRVNAVNNVPVTSLASSGVKGISGDNAPWF